MSKDSMRILVFANNEEKELRARGQELAHNTFSGMHIVNRSPRYFDGEHPSVEPCAAIFVQKKSYPALVEAYQAKGVKIFDISLSTKAKKTEASSEPKEGGEKS